MIRRGLRLNLGCGMRPLAGYINVDRCGEPDVRHDLEAFPWPWEDDSVEEVVLTHVLEHLGHDPKIYLRIMQELYRVCRDDASIRIAVPHHRHDDFRDDPTHVRAVTPLGLCLLSQRLNRQWIALAAANTPLGLYLGVDFELVQTHYKPGDHWFRLHFEPEVDLERLLFEGALHDNLIEEIHMELRVIKPPGRIAGS